ncbi:hypothetical protein CSE16_13570 [Solibacillus sp. R5-41]|uniref:hypothetical protein n=1 Tax=Solibacillus sp. R5-41 TaxID=2048654 RepID=UPI000C125639|nr:hypothetical protein [Solibacillus sp. R5-41]ATP40999.1 hypothetical protein CSE16_13570 [Solibacillus sp. R5-41]
MNEEKQLQQLTEIQVDTAKLEHDFKQIESRINRKKFHWQVPSAVIGVLCIIVFLIASMPKQQIITSENDEEPRLEAIYMLYGEGNPNSKWQMGVDEFTDQESLTHMEQFMNKLILVEKSIPDYAFIQNTYRLNYHDGSSRIIVEYNSGSGSYFYDKTNDHLFSVGKDVIIPSFEHSEKDRIKIIVIIVTTTLYLLLDWLVGRKMREPTDKKRKIPMYSTNKQSIVMIVLSLFTLFIVIITPNIHYFYVVFLCILLAVINIVLETFHGNNYWRKMDIIIKSLWLIVIFHNIFW